MGDRQRDPPRPDQYDVADEMGDAYPELREATPSPPGGERNEPVSEPERLRRALEDSGGHIGRAAASLGMSRPTFWRKRKAYGL